MKIADLIPTVTGSYPKEFLDLVNLLSRNGKAPGDEVTDQLWHAYQFSKEKHTGQLRQSGKPYFEHCYSVARSLAEWQMDHATIMGGILHDCLEDTATSYDDVMEEFGHEVSDLVDGVTKLGDIKFSSRKEKQAENLMKMLLSMTKDIRVIIIKFADRLHNMSTISHLPLIKQRRIAVETRDVYSPLAHRLGMFAVKSELDDLVLKMIEPDNYRKIGKALKSTGGYRKKFIKEVSDSLEEELRNYGIAYTVMGRLKSYTSIYKKMVARDKPLEGIYDIFAIRIIVQDVAACYTVLGIIHQLYTPVHERFKDFIATPKNNGYQSLHTTVIGPLGKMVEIQIRTEEMNRTAEIGVAAHWKYKETRDKDDGLDKQVQWLRDLVGILQDESADPKEFMKLLQIDLFPDEVYVFTPAGDLFQLPAGSTPIDFAYNVHTEVGHRCLSAKVDGRIVPLNTELKSGQTVEIITSDSQSPSYAWLKFIRTSKARTAILRWYRKIRRDESKKLGKEILEKTLRRLKMMSTAKEIKKSPEKTGFSSEEELYIALGTGQVTVREVMREFSPEVSDEQIEKVRDEKNSFLDIARRSVKGVRVQGIENVLIKFSKCCNPIPGDEIVGFVTKGRGVTIHRSHCESLPIMDEFQDRFLEVEWDVGRKEEFLSRIKILAEDRKGYLKDITEAISGLNINITSIDLKVKDEIATCHIVIQVYNLKRLNLALRKINDVEGTITLERG
ncbi:MAG: bifunctional (p)ppGpp synthetase/guanosine-3',5'-bis(diphosphate) 3'-pyrophosphohydrolase [Candidatus Marinimicrobia bacterium]|nr:bifunctional (p)ppGpp synthetase/guanosine-3',5'-bis(diphosphate) 3'-pyrophosphohydrolase [Candidatus Neomarinimicrobiota bacterium]MDP6592893.1 bifunctional (p)ppGpp synthetase/guanosine-3',5'-bis(diphosphate) 3'-pyrophosphohydrolase [Candidatus Neomarinimicrobiota bacterium]